MILVVMTSLLFFEVYRYYVWQIERYQGLALRAVKTRSVAIADSSALRGVITDSKYRELSDGGWSNSDKGLEYRRYGNKPLAVHLVGQLDHSQNLGISGIEAWYDDFLRSPANVGVYKEKEVSGKYIPGRGTFIFPPTNNYVKKNVVLTLNKDIQALAENICDGVYEKKLSLKNGAVVVMDISTGDILAMVSRPTYEPLKPIADNNNNNFLNKALQFYYPGSIFKILVSAAALEKNLIKPNEIFTCDGKYTVNSKVYISCWNIAGHGKQTFTQGFANSCNVVYITLGERLTKINLENYLNKFGLLEQKIIGYANIKKPPIAIGKGKAALANASIGQQGIKISPVQAATIVSVIARNGKSITPRIVKEVRNFNGSIIKTFPIATSKQVIEVNTAKKLQYMMEEVTYNGTGKNAWIEKYGSAGKTGSAQTGMKDAAGKDIVHAWFAGYVPSSNPRYAIVVFVEDGKYGGTAAAPIFKAIGEKLLVREDLYGR